ncbi:MAG: prolipoprotein diacylglyceryl transferase [Acidimicrobiales bacterium]
MSTLRRSPVLAFLDYSPIVKLHLGPLAMSPHALGIVFGFLAGAWLVRPAMRRRGIADDQLYDCLSRAALGAIVGARLAYVINHLGEYSGHPLDAFAIWKGGISLLGGIFGAVLAAYPLMRRYRLAFLPMMDAAAPGLALGILLGRVGDLVVGDHLGKPTDFALGFRCTGADSASPCVAPIGHAVHLPALYDLVSVSVLLVVLCMLGRRRWADGFLIVFFAVWYGTGRFIEDFFRIDVTHGTGLTGSQWTSIVSVVVGVVLLVRLARRGAVAEPVSEADAQLDTPATQT